MNKSDLAQQLAQKTNLRLADVELALNATIAAMTDALLQGRQVHVRGFGRLYTKLQAAKNSRNPHTGETLWVPAKRAVRFAVSDKLLLRLNGEGWASVRERSPET